MNVSRQTATVAIVTISNLKDEPMTDSFDEFRKQFGDQSITSKTTPELVVNRSTRQLYEAFGTKDKIIRLGLRCSSSDMGHSLQYNYITNVTYKLSDYSEIFLTVGGLTVTITGINLKPIVDALNHHTCDFIQEYDPAQFAEPSNKDQPLVRKIEVGVIRAPTQASHQ